MNRKICLFAGKLDGVTKETLKNVFPNSSQVICRNRFCFVTFPTVTEALQVLQYQSVNVCGVYFKISWAHGSYSAAMLPGQLQREKKKAEEEQAKQEASQGCAVVVPIGSVQPMMSTTYVQPQQANMVQNTSFGYQGNYAPTYQLVGQVMPAPLVNLGKNPAQNVQNYAPVVIKTHFGQQPLMPGQNLQPAPLMMVPGNFQSSTANVGPQINPPMFPQVGPLPGHGPLAGQNLQGQVSGYAANVTVAPQLSQTGPPMPAPFGPLPGQVIVPQYQGQFFGKQNGPNGPSRGQQ